MNFIGIVLFIPLWIFIEYLCVSWAVKKDPELFYSLHQSEIDRVLKKMDNKHVNISHKDI